MGHNDSMIYFAVKVFRDDDFVISDSFPMDMVMFNFGGDMAGVGVFANPGKPPRVGIQFPFRIGENFFYALDSAGNGPFPTYEVGLKKDGFLAPPPDTLSFFVGVMDHDEVGQSPFFLKLGFGVNYTEEKRRMFNNGTVVVPWGFPRFVLSGN